MALSLVLSWLYLLWRDQGRLSAWVRNPRIYLPCLAVGTIVAVAGYEIGYASRVATCPCTRL